MRHLLFLHLHFTKNDFSLVNCSAPASGPLALVQRCREKGVRVRVAVRHCAGVRGEVEGRVLAFDRHINLVRPSPVTLHQHDIILTGVRRCE